MGVCDQKTTEAILDFFYENGGEDHSTVPNSAYRPTGKANRLQVTSLTRRTTTSSGRARSGSVNG
jgi:hypothetical protein